MTTPRSPRRPSRLLAATAILAPALALSSGCDFIDQLTQTSGVVDVFATSHGNPDADGNLPDRNGDQVVFVNDMGWQVVIDDAVVTTAGVTLQSCDGARFDVELYWGALAEDMSGSADYDITGLGGVRADSGTYCDLLVEYAPLAEGMDNPEAEGATVFLAGAALKDGETVEFVWRTELAVDVSVDISAIQAGGPFEIAKSQAVSKQLTVAKSYNAFFDGIDFADELSQDEIDSLLAATLSDETKAFVGTQP